LLVLRRATAEDKNLAFALNNFAIATDRLYRRSDLHSFLTNSFVLFNLLFSHPLSMTRTRLHNSRKDIKERQILHKLAGFTTPGRE